MNVLVKNVIISLTLCQSSRKHLRIVPKKQRESGKERHKIKGESNKTHNNHMMQDGQVSYPHLQSFKRIFPFRNVGLTRILRETRKRASMTMQTTHRPLEKPE
mmetsp:Transcript_8509/g.20493  ORF Transcript_8509/g.20493 Transcript_8509/m.20493 type:complete len:103 (+) Transcript_8509:2514-2822(+)